MIISSDNPIWQVTADQSLPIIGMNREVHFDSVLASSTQGFYSQNNMANPSTHLFWRSNDAAVASTIDIPTFADADIDFLAIAAHNIGTIGGRISIQGVGVGDSPAGFQTLISDRNLNTDVPIIFRWLPHIWANLRITVSPGSDYPQIGVVHIGKLITFERSVVIDAGHVAFPFGQDIKQVIGKSINGQLLGKLVTSRRAISTLQFSYIDIDWFRANLERALRRMHTETFFVAWDPFEYPDDVAYAWLIEDAKPNVDPITRRVFLSLVMEGIIATQGIDTGIDFLQTDDGETIFTDDNLPIFVENP